ncbi:nucleotidyltransferase family protein [Azotosporobacter soli]|uniref:nucleotidyltransferase family protein n=1 Tax=Azotosporobacter soli TaxID=3055040 RepID=UPI0031FF356B
MKDWQNCLITPSTTILEAIKIIDDCAVQIAVIVDENNKLLGTVTDGDIRRAILHGVPLTNSVQDVMNSKPIIARENQKKHAILAKMNAKSLQQIPLLDSKGIVVGIELLKELMGSNAKENPVILMAGGLGSRLQPLTDHCPKPLLEIGSKPILETILENFIEYGFEKFYIAVNYKAEMIEKYFGDGSKFGVQIQYIHEKKRMGTAGALSLLLQKSKVPLVVMNGDLLTKVNFQHLIDFHMERQAMATMCVREYSYQIPYGVIEIEQGQITKLQEKPACSAFVNAGIYVLNPEAVEMIPQNTFFDMTDLFNKLIAEQKTTAAFPIREYWLDIGQMDDFKKAKDEFVEVFG